MQINHLQFISINMGMKCLSEGHDDQEYENCVALNVQKQKLCPGELVRQGQGQRCMKANVGRKQIKKDKLHKRTVRTFREPQQKSHKVRFEI